LSTTTETQQQPRNAGNNSTTISLEIEQADIDSAIKTLQEESHQMVELMEIEKTYAAESVLQFKRIIEPLMVSYDVKDAWNTARGENIQAATLTAEGIVCVTFMNGVVQAKPLESVRCETLLKILSIAIPEVKQILVERREITSLRAGVLEKIAKELSKVSLESQSA
jgi:hypothetical protein